MITNMDKYKSSGNLILIPKLEDYIRYTFQILIKIPRIEKFNIGSEIKTSCLKMLEYAHFLNKDRRNGYVYLNKIDALISYNKSMLRILNEEKSISKNNFEASMEKLSEIWKTSPAWYRWDANYGNANDNKGFRATLILLSMLKFKDLFQ